MHLSHVSEVDLTVGREQPGELLLLLNWTLSVSYQLGGYRPSCIDFKSIASTQPADYLGGVRGADRPLI